MVGLIHGNHAILESARRDRMLRTKNRQSLSRLVEYEQARMPSPALITREEVLLAKVLSEKFCENATGCSFFGQGETNLQEKPIYLAAASTAFNPPADSTPSLFHRRSSSSSRLPILADLARFSWAGMASRL